MIKFSDVLNRVFSKTGNAFFYTPPYYNNSYSYLFENLENSLQLDDPGKLTELFQEVDNHKENGYLYYASLNYELGYYFEEKLNKYLDNHSGGLGYFRFFDHANVRKIKSTEILIDPDNDPKESFITKFQIKTPKQKFIDDIKKIKKFIAEGYTYQVNYTTSASFSLTPNMIGFIKSLIFNQTARYIAVINNDTGITISISPELFFRIKDGKITSKPMKGTIKRGINLAEDSQQLNQLMNSTKDTAENIMIVDLIRNDLGQICEFNSVKNTRRLNIEKYETIYQLTSTIEGKLRAKSTGEILKSIFPCGSITGAPKLKTMQIIKELEGRERGVYTGAIGFYDGQSATFNVPIRTVEIDSESNKGKVGIGSGIVWDSVAEDEYNECKSKVEFLTKPYQYFELIETMLVKEREIFLKEYHIERLKKAASFFLFLFDEEKIRSTLNEVILKEEDNGDYKIRLLLNKWGKISIQTTGLNHIPFSGVVLSKEKIDTRHKYQYFKTTNRKHYDCALRFARENGFLDSIFANERDEVAEGAITNIFIKRKDKLVTPPIESGILNGCYRQYLIDTNKAEEDIVKLNELQNADSIYVANSVIELIKVSLRQ